ncbi:MAG: ABC transporter substrate-binding protein [Devosia sp.]|nr:ABC transporter substrate-binding protein [Devosia sp.]
MATLASARATPAADVSLMVGGIEKQIYLPVVLAQQLGYFREQGINVELDSEPAGVEAADEMLAGAVQGVVGFYDHTIELQSLGKYTESVVQFGQAPGEVEIVSSKHPEIGSVADFRGRNIGVTGLGSSTDFLTEYLLVRAGLKLSDVTPVPVGAGDTLISALRHDQIHAAMTTEPTVSRLLKSGEARVLVDARTLAGSSSIFGGTYAAGCIYMETSWVETHRDIVQKLASAMVKTMRYIATHSAAEIAAQMPPAFYVDDEPLYVEALSHGLQMFTPDGRMPADAPNIVLAVLSQIRGNLKDKTIDLSKTYTNEFVDRANQSP